MDAPQGGTDGEGRGGRGERRRGGGTRMRRHQRRRSCFYTSWQPMPAETMTRPCPPGRYGSFPAEEGATTTKAAARAEAFVLPSPPFPATPSTSTFEHLSTGGRAGMGIRCPGSTPAAWTTSRGGSRGSRRRRSPAEAGGGTGTPPKSESLQNLPSLAWVASAAADAKAQAADAPLQRYQ